MYVFRFTRTTESIKDPSSKEGYYIREPSLSRCVERAAKMQTWPSGTYIDFQVWEKWDKGRQVLTDGPGCAVARYMLTDRGIEYVETYQHP